MLKDELQKILSAAKERLDSPALNADELEQMRVQILGKKGELTALLKGMKDLSAEERPVFGQMANEVRAFIETGIAEKAALLREKALELQLAHEKLDVTEPGKAPEIGKRHPLSQTEKEMCDIFFGMGFEIVEGPEVEYDYYNFQALNIPENHPARDTQDTFYVTDNILLRSQTSGVQVRAMQKQKPPIRVISPGFVYRSDPMDATHSPVFHQLEGLVVDKGITMGDLKGTLEIVAKRMFGENSKIRFRPHHFPFTEPSAEVDVSCFACGGKGCRLCKGEGWIEILGAGMVHPNVLRECNIDPEVYSGFAFGIGIERVFMLKNGVDDLRYLYENDARFLGQF